MAKYCGDDGVIKWVTDTDALVGTADTPALVTQVKSFSIDETAALIETTSKGDAAVTRKKGRTSFSGSATLQYDHALAPHVDAKAGDVIDLEVYPTGDASGRKKLTGLAVISSVSYQSPEGDSEALLNVNFSGNGALVHTTIV